MATDKKYFYANIANEFDDLMDSYDLTRRLEVVFGELLPSDLAGLQLLDVGCGTGWFSQRAAQQGAIVTALDVGESLLRQTMDKTTVCPVAGDALYLPFRQDSFDVVLSSEVIEHTVSPPKSVKGMARVLKPGGMLVLTTPNRLWQWAVTLATRLHVRPFEGYENFVSFVAMEEMITGTGLVLEEHRGFHPWPFQIRCLTGLSRAVDDHYGRGAWGQLMINQAVRAVKRWG